MPARVETMLRTYAALPWVVGSVFSKLGFVQNRGPQTRNQA